MSHQLLFSVYYLIQRACIVSDLAGNTDYYTIGDPLARGSLGDRGKDWLPAAHSISILRSHMKFMDNQ